MALKAKLAQEQLQVDIQVDGGINPQTVPVVLEAGANVIVAGTAVFRGDVKENVAGLEALAQQ